MRLYFFFNLQRQSLLVHEMARHLQDTRGWRDFAGVVVVMRGKHCEYLQRQKDVVYQSLDTIEAIERVAVDHPVAPAQLKTWEQRLERPLWHLVVADRNIGRTFVKGGRILHTDISNMASHDTIARLVCYYLDFYQKRLGEFGPDAVFLTASASLPTLALAEVCRWMKIPFFTLRHTRILDRYIMSHDDPTERFLAVEKRFHELLEQPDEAPPPDEQAVRYYESFQESQSGSADYMVGLNRAQQYMRRKSPLQFWGGRGYRLGQAFGRWLRYQDRSKRDIRFSSPLEEWWLETQRVIGVRYPHTPFSVPPRIGQEPYVYFPLHLDPEAATMILAPNFVNQLTVIEALVKNIPLTHKLYVKEHPSMLGRRPRSFYEVIKEYPNVRLLATEEDSLRLVRGADLVAVITGTAGWEAILMGRPVISFGHAFYTYLGFSERCSDFEKLGLQIRRLVFGRQATVSREHLLLFLTALFENSFRLSADVTWRKDLQPGRLDDESVKAACTMAEQLATAIERRLAEQASVLAPGEGGA